MAPSPSASWRSGSADQTAALIAAQRGDLEAFTGLVHHYQGLVRAYLGRLLLDPGLVEDVAQETFIGAFRSLGTYDLDLPFQRWLLGIARHQAGSCLRRELRRRRRESDVFDVQMMEWVSEASDTATGDDTADQLLALDRCRESLPGHAADLVNAVYFQGQDISALATRLRRSENALRLMLCRIRRDLRACIERQLTRSQGAP